MSSQSELELDEIFKGLVAVFDEAGDFGEKPSKVGFNIVGIPEAKQALLKWRTDSTKKMLPKKQGKLFYWWNGQKLEQPTSYYEGWNDAISDMEKKLG